MESYAIDTIGTAEKIPYLIVKKPFDVVSPESKKIDPKKFTDCLSDFDYQKLLTTIYSFLEKNEDQAENQRQAFLEKTLQVYKLTFSEKEIWKK